MDIAVRQPVLAAKNAARAVAHTVTRSVGDGRLLRLDSQLQLGPAAAAIFPGAARAPTEFVARDMQREADLRHLDAAEFQPAGRVPLAHRMPAVPAGRTAAARPGVEHVPDEAAPVARVPALDGNAQPAPPAGHGARRTGLRKRRNHGFDDLVAAMRGAHGDRKSVLGPHDRAFLQLDRERTECALVLRDLRVDQVGEGLRHRRDRIGVAGVDESGTLRVGRAQVHRHLSRADSRGGANGDVMAAVTVIVEKGLAVEDALLPGCDFGARAAFGPVQNRFASGHDGVRVERIDQRLEPGFAKTDRADLRRQVALEVARVAHIQRHHLQKVLARVAPLPEPKRRDTQPLMENLGSGGVVGAVGRASDIAVMGAVDRPEGQPPVDEHRREHRHIRQVAAAARIGIVDDEQVAFMHILAEAGRNRLRRPRHRAHMDRDMLRLRNQPAVAIADGGGEVARRVENLRIGGAQHRLAHLLDDGRQPVADHGDGDRVEIARHRRTPWKTIA